MLARIRDKCPRAFTTLGIVSFIGLSIILWTVYSNNSNSASLLLNPPESLFKIEEIPTSYTKTVEFIKSYHLTPPSTKEYNLSSPGTHGNSYSSLVHKILGNSTTGVFIEAGAYDGEDTSNSLPLELLGWKGILIECNPDILPKLRSKNRKAWIADVCLSKSNKTESIKYFSSPDWPHNAGLNNQLTLAEMKVHGYTRVKNQTLIEHERLSVPLNSIIEAVGQFSQIDLMSLDVQGAEFDILEYFPYQRFPVKVIIAEVFTCSANRKKIFKKMMQSKGYRFYAGNGVDYTFVLNESN